MYLSLRSIPTLARYLPLLNKRDDYLTGENLAASIYTQYLYPCSFMPSYAILGSTGNVRGAALKVLLGSNHVTIHAYCRSKQKLVKQNPGIEKNNNIRIFEGAMHDEALLAECIAGAQAVFVAIAVTANQPGVTIAQDTAHQVVAAMKKLREQRSQPLPKLLILSSASTEHRLMWQVPRILRNILYCAMSNVYDDLKAAETFYRSQDDWLSTIFIKPGALTHDAQKGHEINNDIAKSPISFLDLAAGMIEIADEDGDRYDGKAVAINATSKDVAFPLDSPLLLIKGLIVHFLPWTWRFLG